MRQIRELLDTYVFHELLHEVVVGVLYGGDNGCDVQHTPHQLIRIPVSERREPHRLEHLAHKFLHKQ